MTGERDRGGVQSIVRAFAVLEALADRGPTGVSGLAEQLGLPLPTVHRLIRTLVDLGYVRQESSRQYLLGPRFMRLRESSARDLESLAQPHLRRLVDEVGESANLAMLDDDHIVYLAQAPSPRSMRMFTEVGHRVLPHCTAVGKAILSTLPDPAVDQILRRTGMPAATPQTLTDRPAFLEHLVEVRAQGFALDEGEQEVGVRCVAVAVPATRSRLAISISAPSNRLHKEDIPATVPLLLEAGRRLANDLT